MQNAMRCSKGGKVLANQDPKWFPLHLENTNPYYLFAKSEHGQTEYGITNKLSGI